MERFEFHADHESPDKEAAALTGQRDEKKRFRGGLLLSALFHFGVPLSLFLFLPTLSPFFGKNNGPGAGKDTVIEVTLESAMPSEAEGPVAAIQGGASPASQAQAAPPPAPAAPPPAPVQAPAPEPAPPEPPPVKPAEPLVEEKKAEPPPKKDELKEALEKADLALKQTTADAKDGKAPDNTDASTSRTRLLSNLAKPRPAAPEAASGQGGGDFDMLKAAPGRKGGRAGNAAASGGGFGNSLSGDVSAGGVDDGLNRWRSEVIAKVNRYFASNLSNKFLFPDGRFLHIHIRFFPDATVDRVDLRPPSSINPGKMELDYFEKVRRDIERAQPLPKPENPQYLEQGVPVRVRSIRIAPD